MPIMTQPPSFDVSPTGDRSAPSLHIVLVSPEIPPNTGSIARLCAATDAWLHLVRPLGFELDDRRVKRAGLDYWPNVRLSVHTSWTDLEDMLPWERTWLFSKKANQRYTDVSYPEGAVLVFGRETRGLPEDLLETHNAHALMIPQTVNVRSLNLAQAAAVACYEVIRQRGIL